MLLRQPVTRRTFLIEESAIVSPSFAPRHDDGDPFRVDSSVQFVKKGDTEGSQAYCSVDGNWMHGVAAACQEFAGSTLTIDRSRGPAVREFLGRIGNPRNPAEEIMLRVALYDVAVGWAAQAHRLYHDVHPATCSFSVADVTHSFWRHDNERRGKIVFVRWARRFWPVFLSAHPPSAAARLAHLFSDEYWSRANVVCLARLVGCQHAMLRRQFFSEFGMSIIEYRNSVRVEHE